MGILETIKSKLKKMFGGESSESGAQFLQWQHPNLRKRIVLLVNLII